MKNRNETVQISRKSAFLSPKETWFLLFVFIVGSFLFFLNLGNIYLWQDEAQTALLAQSILEFGVPTGYDGLNYFSQEQGAEYGDNYIWRWHPWLTFYILAPFFKFFGNSTFVARFPFALVGLASLFVLYFFSRSLLNDKKSAALSVLILLFCVPYLLLSRQCRYYSLATFLSLTGLYGYHAMTKGKKYSFYVYTLSCILLFHTHYIYMGTLIGTVGIHTILFHRSLFKKILFSTCITLTVNAPWIVWFSGMKYGAQYETRFFNLGELISWIASYVVPLHDHVFHSSLLLIPIAVAIGNRYKKKKVVLWEDDGFWPRAFLPLLFIGTTITAVSLVGSSPFFRFVAPVIPLLAMTAALFFGWAIQFHRPVGFFLLILFFWLTPMGNFLYEITHDYDGPIEGIVTYLNKNGQKSDTVVITYGDFPLKFYTPFKVLGGLTGEDLSQGLSAEWIILRKNAVCEKDQESKKFLRENVFWDGYSKIELPYPDIPFENRESPRDHLFKTNKDESNIVLYKRKKGSVKNSG